ncbi:hypothetical protein EVAR_90652_1 [Eumeta japonica]|uniref:Uncharacterized protein n=1 Tax=Eumeta variegata TaxID=151549 RepID=A0A4C1ZEK0_EUMVA|nr:hypothetical protein EVAR_90652_1 [Eumeta japonica]
MIGDACIKNDGLSRANSIYSEAGRVIYIAAEAKTGFTPTLTRCTAIPACGVAPSVACASCSPRVVAFAAYRTRPRPRAPSFRFTTARAPSSSRAPSAVLRERSTSAEHSAPPMDKSNFTFLTGAASTSCGNGSRIRCRGRQRSANARPSEGTSSLTRNPTPQVTLPITRAPRSGAVEPLKSKPKAAGLTQTSDGSMCWANSRPKA